MRDDHVPVVVVEVEYLGVASAQAQAGLLLQGAAFLLLGQQLGIEVGDCGLEGV